MLEKRYPESIFYKGVVVDAESKLGKYNVLFENVKICNSTLGSHSYVQKHSSLINCSIGKFCSVAANVTIGLGQHPTNHVSTHPAFFSKNQPLAKTFSDEERYSTSSPVLVGHDVWIGHSAMILDGIVIGNGAIVAAGAVVTKDVPSFAIVAGVPAKVIKYRFTEDECRKINQLKWWDKSDDWLRKNSFSFFSPEILLKNF